MNKWEERWRNGKTGWHRNEVNANLIQFINEIEPINNSKILIPLCGKSLDVGWLADQGATVVGVDLVLKPLKDFFNERESNPTQTFTQGLTKLSDGQITMVHSDIFEFNSEIEGTFDVIYDRAAMVALPPQLREKYVEHCSNLLKPNGQIFLITYDAPKADDQGPPYPVREGTVEHLFSQFHDVKLLNKFTTSSEEDPRLKLKNLEWAQTNVWNITK